MKRYIQLLLLAATPIVVACSGVEDGIDVPSPDAQQELLPVSFNAYVNRNTTRAGQTGELSLATLGASAGFGVFAYYTNGQLYSQMSLPDFMYNQQVTSNDGGNTWIYSPVKYWPNEPGSTAMSEKTDYLTFFAYAPYADVNPNTGKVVEEIDPVTGKPTIETDPTFGIFGMTRAKDTGDPYVKYRASYDPTKAVDLCWSNTNFSNTNNIDLTKPAVNSTVSFNFQHALAALNVQIDADVDLATHADPGKALDENTRIYVRSITFRGFAEKGQLNLNLGNWNNLDCDCDLTSQPITIYDGRRDGREGVAASLNETRTGLNPDIIQSGAYDPSKSFSTTPGYSTTPGVTNTTVNLFNSSTAADPIYVIPTNDPLEVTIVYDVETYDPKLVSQYLSDGRTHGSTIENNITATILTNPADPTTTIQMTTGKKYNIHLHLGMTSVKVDASVTAWPTTGTNADVELPDN